MPKKLIIITTFIKYHKNYNLSTLKPYKLCNADCFKVVRLVMVLRISKVSFDNWLDKSCMKLVGAPCKATLGDDKFIVNFSEQRINQYTLSPVFPIKQISAVNVIYEREFINTLQIAAKCIRWIIEKQFHISGMIIIGFQYPL